MSNSQKLPGIGNTTTAVMRKVLKTDRGAQYLPTGVLLDGSETRDTANTGYLTTLRAGNVLGKITSGGKYAPSIIGLTGVLHDTSVVTTTMTLPAAIVTEIARRQGASGTFKITGPPAAAGTVVTETVTYSAIASTTTITITATTADFAAGSIIAPVDGSETPLVILNDGPGVKVIDEDANDIDVTLPQVIIAGTIDTSKIVNVPTEVSTLAWLKAQLNTTGKFIFDDVY